ncbi:HAMP domain-containing sensor histidine kinase [Rhodoligotrophos defluvii]|uniref:HAMP domain-containing sensor histidine kinase n=1 Tax=Rhodoligotrophos defluvii TaxID=2561934 RepID=UPI0010C9372B|nr:HAMP domain-containing sensor histidine kinase [Rhodoligotrophos defluvii]
MPATEDSWPTRWGKLLRTSTFRLAAAYLLLFAISSAAILSYVYWDTAGLLARQTDQTIAAEVTSFAEQYRNGGITALARSINNRSENADDSIYLLVNVFGRRIAGNLQGMPVSALGSSPNWIEFPYAVQTADGMEKHQARAFHIRLDMGYTLLVGRDIQERRQFTEIIRRTLFWALGLTLLLGLGGGLLMSRNFLKRVDSIAETSRTIMEGDLAGRMPVSGTGDELDRLAISLNQMLEQIERLMIGMREVSSNVAHDLKTPLTRLRAQAEDALRDGSPERYRKALEETLEEADSLLRIFNALLSIARAEAGQSREGVGPMDAADLAGDMAELYGPLIEDDGGRFTAEIDKPLPVKADRQLLAQALNNLFDNVLKYGRPEDGRTPVVTLSARREGADVVIAVADNGPGVPEDQRGRVVERFVRLDASRSKPGSGLGLSLVASVMKLHGGKLELRDNQPGLIAELRLPALAGTADKA